MNDFVDWDASILFTDDVLGMSKAQWREKLAADTEQFLADGGEIELLPYDWKAELAGRVGYWKPMGQDELDDMLDAESTETIVY